MEAEIKAEKEAILDTIRAKNAENDVQKKQGLEEELTVLKASLEDLKTTRDKFIELLRPAPQLGMFIFNLSSSKEKTK